MQEISCFISPHGYGHATRAIAVLDALTRLVPELQIRIITTVAESLFAETLENFHYHPVHVDIGLVQSSALGADIPATIKALDLFLPFDKSLTEKLAAICRNSSLILCDIAPLGIAVARLCEIPSLLVENFTWDWIYTPYIKNHPEIEKHIDYLQKLFTGADYRIQTSPLCHPAPNDLFCGPIFRQKTKSNQATRDELQWQGKNVVVVTMGGVDQKLPDLGLLKESTNFSFVFTRQNEDKKIAANILLLAKDNPTYHPNLICAADIVICKAGYSTVAECCQAGVHVITVGRSNFAESTVLENYLKSTLSGATMTQKDYFTGNWSPALSEVLRHPRPHGFKENGALSAAKFITKLCR